jgi:hypothetical protein
MSLLDNVPVATLSFIAGVVVSFVAYLNGDLTVQEALVAVGAVGGGAGVIGHARNGAGRGVKR